MPLLQPSGGLVYHLRAWRYRQQLWAPFHAQVRHWLSRWQPAARHLILVGPSGGYALEPGFLARFTRISVLEPDALARHVLRCRFNHPAWTFHTDADLARPDGFDGLAHRYPAGAFLFCNLLGQRLVGQGADFPRDAWLARLGPALAGRDWASWHDVASTQRPPDRETPLGLPRGGQLDGALGHFWTNGELSIHDHGCEALAPDLPRDYALWTLRPGQYHVVEWVKSDHE